MLTNRPINFGRRRRTHRSQVTRVARKDSNMTSMDRPTRAEASPPGAKLIDNTHRLRILIADDHTLVRDALAEVIRHSSRHEVLVADSLKAAHSVIRSTTPIDILLLDLNMPDMEGIKSVEKTVALPGVEAVVLISGNAPRDIVLQAVARGAKGYIPKSMRLAALMNALNFVAMGETYLPASMLGAEVDARPAVSQDISKPLLSARETEVLRLVIEGLPNKEIARRCGSTEVRVKMHMRSICKKLDVPNRTSAAMRARELGLF